jgi:hypothetical protein
VRIRGRLTKVTASGGECGVWLLVAVADVVEVASVVEGDPRVPNRLRMARTVAGALRRTVKGGGRCRAPTTCRVTVP